MLYLVIPPLLLSILFFLNARKKGFRFIVSNVLLAYLLMVFVSAIFISQNPLSGEPFVYPPAVLYLAFCFLLIAIPVLQMKDGTEVSISKDIPPSKYTFLVSILLVLLLPAAIYSSNQILLLREFISADMTKSEFGQQQDTQIRGNLFLLYVYFVMSFSFPCLFLAVYSWVMKRGSPLVRVLLLFCGFTPGLQGFRIMSRSAMINCLFYAAAAVLVFLLCQPKNSRKKIPKSFLILAGLALIPILVVSWSRFKDEMLYWMFGYFCDGPYSFGAFYYAIREMDIIPSGGGMYSFPFFLEILNKVFRMPIPEGFDPEWSSQCRLEYYYICRSTIGSFKTVIGALLLDFSRTTVACIMAVFSLLFTTFFRRASIDRISTIYAMVLFAHFVFYSTIGFLFTTVPGNMQFLVSILFYFVLRLMEKDDTPDPGDGSAKDADNGSGDGSQETTDRAA